jgi:hypothetical protein
LTQRANSSITIPFCPILIGQFLEEDICQLVQKYIDKYRQIGKNRKIIRFLSLWGDTTQKEYSMMPALYW